MLELWNPVMEALYTPLRGMPIMPASSSVMLWETGEYWGMGYSIRHIHFLLTTLYMIRKCYVRVICYVVKSSLFSDKISKLPANEREKIYAVIDTMIAHSSK